MRNGTATKGAPWIGVDFDRTLAYYPEANGIQTLGAPIPAMVARVKGWIAEGKRVKIVTARVSSQMDAGDRQWHKGSIYKWCIEHLGKVLEVTAEKDLDMVELWDDAAITVERNTGRRLTPGE
jgi:hypothetical protein